MTLRSLLALLEGLTCLVSAVAIEKPVQLLQLPTDTDETNRTVTLIAPGVHPSLVNTGLTVLDPVCVPQLGTNIDPASCRNAISKIPRTTDRITLGWRGEGNFDLTLPYIWTSGMLQRLNVCFVQLSKFLSAPIFRCRLKLGQRESC